MDEGLQTVHELPTPYLAEGRQELAFGLVRSRGSASKRAAARGGELDDVLTPVGPVLPGEGLVESEALTASGLSLSAGLPDR